MLISDKVDFKNTKYVIKHEDTKSLKKNTKTAKQKTKA